MYVIILLDVDLLDTSLDILPPVTTLYFYTSLKLFSSCKETV